MSQFRNEFLRESGQNRGMNVLNKPWSPLQSPPRKIDNPNPDIIHLSGVRWDIAEGPDGKLIEQGVFGEAQVRPDAIEDVYLCVKPFTENPGGMPGHALLDFQFRADSPVVDGKGNQDSGLAVSMEVRFREGQVYDPIGSDEPQPVVFQLGTWKDAIEKATVYDKNPLRRYKLNLSHEQKKALLTERLNTATQDHSQNLYDPVLNSCLSTAIDGVNLVLPESQKMPRVRPDGSMDPNAVLPVWSNKLFYKHGVISKLGPDQTIPATKG